MARVPRIEPKPLPEHQHQDQFKSLLPADTRYHAFYKWPAVHIVSLNPFLQGSRDPQPRPCPSCVLSVALSCMNNFKDGKVFHVPGPLPSWVWRQRLQQGGLLQLGTTFWMWLPTCPASIASVANHHTENVRLTMTTEIPTSGLFLSTIPEQEHCV